MSWSLPTLIRIDAIAGLTAGLVLYFGREVWWPLSGLSAEWFARLGIIGICYGTFSATITLLKAYRPIPVWTLIIANLLYAVFCLGLLLSKTDGLSLLGHVHLLAETLFVGGLAWLESRAMRSKNPLTIEH
ncbi:MAG: hypothetical protein IPJ76_17325 [Flavobacteriales bacterium]|nr:MAG: hypothetical protein IPJ76_17325 [Flavobacteriales bacterium]